jgi:hypothetical protein
MLQAATLEAAAPSRLAEMAGHVKSQCQHQGWGLRLANRLCTSICGFDHMKTLPKGSASSK